MKQLILLVTITVMNCCTTNTSFEKEYYENITKIKFPHKYKIVATEDNGEFLTITIIDLDKDDCRKFVSENNFKPINNEYSANLMGLNFLKENFKKISNTKSLLIRQLGKIEGKTGWTYLVDTTKCRIYCEIDYPDFGGN